MDYIEVSAKTVEEAKMQAAIKLGKPSTDLDFTVISQGSKGFLGLGSKPAVVRAAIKEEKTVAAEPVKEVKKTEKKPVVKEVKEAKEPKAVKEPKEKKEAKETAEVKEAKPEVNKEKSETEKPRNNDRRKDHNRKKNNKKNIPNDRNERKEERRPAAAEHKKPEIRDEIVEKTAEEIADMKASAEKFLKDVFGAMNMEVVLEMNYIKEGGCLEVDLSGADMGPLIGKRGQTLDSLQYLTSLVVNKNQKTYVRVKLDTEDYRRRRKETLENLAKNIASKVKKTRKTVVLEPMNPYERRIIHSALQPNKYVETYSEGNEPYRHVVVTLKKYDK